MDIDNKQPTPIDLNSKWNNMSVDCIHNLLTLSKEKTNLFEFVKKLSPFDEPQCNINKLKQESIVR